MSPAHTQRDVVIRAQGLGKSYLVGRQQRTGRETLRDLVSATAANAGRTFRDLVCGRPVVRGDRVERFWALRGVDFEIRRGDVVGLIGRNGAGKSTLLKVLSRISEPCEGRVELTGRLASLLEVGTGFHPELSGRENIYLNGAILGMRRAEIRQRFDEIVAFAGVERFLDTPVKRYSSGMYVRLAFAVAAHLEPEILVVDEVLAVGDAEFQRKCLGKMKDVAQAGRTVLFVSHNMSVIKALCPKAMLLEDGRVSSYGATADTIAAYRAAVPAGDVYIASRSDRKEVAVRRVEARAAGGGIEVTLDVSCAHAQKAAFLLRLRDEDGMPVALATRGGLGGTLIDLAEGCSRHRFCVDAARLASGRYWIGVQVHSSWSMMLAEVDDAVMVEHEQTPLAGFSKALQASFGHGHVQLEVSHLDVTAHGAETAMTAAE